MVFACRPRKQQSLLGLMYCTVSAGYTVARYARCVCYA